MVLAGVVTNVTAFGAFVDVGVAALRDVTASYGENASGRLTSGRRYAVTNARSGNNEFRACQATIS
jgi:hypothetical protein